MDQDVRIYTDSKYTINCVDKWHKTWEKNDWLTTSGEEVKNKDIIQAVRAKIEDRDAAGTRTLFEWVKGHNGLEGNEQADKLAVKGAKSSRAK